MITPGIGLGGSGKALGMGSGIVGASSFLRNLKFCDVILPESSLVVRESFNDFACCVPLLNS